MNDIIKRALNFPTLCLRHRRIPEIQNPFIIFPSYITLPSLKLLLLLLSCFSRVRFCATPYMPANQAPLSLGFSRQEYWSGLPFPSPMHESETWKWSRVRLSATPWTAACQAPPSTGFSRQEYWGGLPFPSPHHCRDNRNSKFCDNSYLSFHNI